MSPLSQHPTNPFTVSPWHHGTAPGRLAGGYRYVVCVDGHPLIEDRSYGPSFMLYPTKRRAKAGLARAQAWFPEAEIEEVNRAAGSPTRPPPAFPSSAPLRVGARALSRLRRLRRRA